MLLQKKTLYFFLFLGLPTWSFSFLPKLAILHKTIPPRCDVLFLLEGNNDDDFVFGNSGGLIQTEETTDDTSWMESLKKRQRALKQGIGKRYVTRTKLGFLNIHYEPTDPHDTNNIVGRLAEGQIVTSTGPTRGFWVPHDGGGWSISKYGGFTWLEPIDE